jgi:hypothetical protein
MNIDWKTFNKQMNERAELFLLGCLGAAVLVFIIWWAIFYKIVKL